MGGGEEVMKVMDVRQLVNGPLSPVGISEDNAIGWEISRKFHSCPRGFASLPTVKLFGLSFSLGNYPCTARLKTLLKWKTIKFLKQIQNLKKKK